MTEELLRLSYQREPTNRLTVSDENREKLSHQSAPMLLGLVVTIAPTATLDAAAPGLEYQEYAKDRRDSFLATQGESLTRPSPKDALNHIQRLM